MERKAAGIALPALLGHGRRTRQVRPCVHLYSPNLKQEQPQAQVTWLGEPWSHFELHSETEPNALGRMGRGEGDLAQAYGERETEISAVKHKQARQAASQDPGSGRESLDLLSHLPSGDQALN